MWVGRVRVEGVSVVWIRLMRKRRVKVGSWVVRKVKMRIGILCEWAKIKLDGIEWNEWEGNERWEGEKGKENVSGESVREERKNLEEENEEGR